MIRGWAVAITEQSVGCYVRFRSVKNEYDRISAPSRSPTGDKTENGNHSVIRGGEVEMKFLIEPFEILSGRDCKSKEVCVYKWCRRLLPIIPPPGN